MIKLNSTTYIELFKDYPNMNMELSGWEWNVKWYLFNTFPIIFYIKNLYKK